MVIPRQAHGFEPFHAVYRRDTCLALVEEALANGEIKASSWYSRAKIREMERSEVLSADPRGGAFMNVNTPDELHAIEQRILEVA